MIGTDGREYDRIGRRQPRRLDWLTLWKGIPDLAAQFRRVPDDYVEGEVVRCPCGRRPTTGPAGVDCECGRIYLRAGKFVWVANSPVSGGNVD